MNEILMKHMCSSANDGYVQYDIDDETKIVTVRMAAGSSGMSFFSDAHLLSIANRIEREHSIPLETVDSNRLDGPPARPEYKLVVAIDEVWYQSTIVLQISLNEDRLGPAVVELLPLRLVDENLNYRLRSADRLVKCKKSAVDAIKALEAKGVTAKLFGSTLTGDVRPRSDVDLLITECAGLSGGEIVHIAEIASE